MSDAEKPSCEEASGEREGKGIFVHVAPECLSGLPPHVAAHSKQHDHPEDYDYRRRKRVKP